jgi:putative membrane protein
VLLGAAATLAAPPPEDKPKTDDKPKAISDQEFVQQASAAGLAEINLGRLAVEQAASDDVKKFGQMMVDEHTKAGDDLNKVADRARITPAPTMDAAHQELWRKLSGMKGADFDRQYGIAMLADHKDTVALFEAEAKNGKNEDLKAMADKTLPALKHHLELAQKLPGAAPEKKEEKKEDKKPEKDKDK